MGFKPTHYGPNNDLELTWIPSQVNLTSFVYTKSKGGVIGRRIQEELLNFEIPLLLVYEFLKFN